MKRRVVSKTGSNEVGTSRFESSLRRGNSVKKAADVRGQAKNLAKKRVAKSAAASILGLKKTSSLSEDSTRWSSDESSIDHVAECKRLREQLERVLVDHQRQEEEIVALRALAKSLKEEVETIHERQLQNSEHSSSTPVKNSRVGSHEFFKLNVQVEELESENAELRSRLEGVQEQLRLAHTCLAEKLPVYKLASVKANAELRCVKSQLEQEREHSDLLQKQLIRCKVRQNDIPIRAFVGRGDNQKEDGNDAQESEIVRREREVFLRQCMRLRDSKSANVPETTQQTAKLSELENNLPTIEIRTESPARKDFTTSEGLTPYMKVNTSLKTNKLIQEDLLGLDFYFDELNFSPNQPKT